jgi:hypothetical protein
MHFIALYIDPGSGSMLWQAVAATVLGGLVTFRTRIAEVFRKRD